MSQGSQREKAMTQQPDFPWLEAGDCEGLDKLLHELGWLAPDERVQGAGRAGEGNMNLTLRIETGARSFVLKQARPWVEKYPDLAAPWERSAVEQTFYAEAAAISGVAERMPRLLAADTATHLIALEDLPGARDLSNLYTGEADALRTDEIQSLALYLASLHAHPGNPGDPRLRNRGMRELNHEHIYRVPLNPENGLDLEVNEPGLPAVARKIMDDKEFCAAVRTQGQRYLAQGSVLLHGDYFPGSWLRTQIGLRIIDPEFTFYGDAEFDLGVAVAHFALARESLQTAVGFLDQYRGKNSSLALSLKEVARNAGVEVMRRLIGVAQLPIPPSDGWRADLLQKSRHALMKEEFTELFL